MVLILQPRIPIYLYSIKNIKIPILSSKTASHFEEPDSWEQGYKDFYTCSYWHGVVIWAVLVGLRDIR